MASLVSQAEAIRQLRLNEAALTADQIGDVMFKAEQASAIIVDYLKRPFIEGPIVPDEQPVSQPPLAGAALTNPFPPSIPPVPPDPWTPATVPILVKGVILIVLTALYDGRTPEDALLSEPVTAALWRLRDPALA